MDEFKEVENKSDSSSQPDMVFHYNREERLKRAPRIVQEFHAGTNFNPPKGIFRRLVYTKSSRLMLITIVILCAGTFVINFLTGRQNRDTLQSVPVTLTAFSFEDHVYVSIKAKEVPDQAFAWKAVITAYTTGKTPAGTVEKTGIYDGKEQVITTTFPDYDILSISADITAKSGESIQISADVTH